MEHRCSHTGFDGVFREYLRKMEKCKCIYYGDTDTVDNAIIVRTPGMQQRGSADKQEQNVAIQKKLEKSGKNEARVYGLTRREKNNLLGCL